MDAKNYKSYIKTNISDFFISLNVMKKLGHKRNFEKKSDIQKQKRQGA